MMTLDTAYTDWIHARITAWVKANPADYKQLRVSVWERTKRDGQTLPERGTFASDYLNAMICEEIRRLNSWPSERQYEAGARLTPGHDP